MPLMLRRLLTALLCVLPAIAPAETCHGQNLLTTLPAAELAALQAKADAQPYAHGNLWTATKAGQKITLAGTYHLTDPRFGPILIALEPALTQATSLLVEAGPDEEAALKSRIASDPGAMFITSGPTLADQLGPQNWARLSTALQARGMFPIMAAKMQPWLVTTLLQMPACRFPIDPGVDLGLDKQLMARATALNLPIRALEPFDTILGVFAQFTAADQIAMLSQTIAADDPSGDLSATLADSYFAGESLLFLTYAAQVIAAQPGMTQAEADRENALIDRALISGRNAAWIPVLEAAAARGPVVAAFGALHLPGQNGVLNLLARRGWTIAPFTTP